MAMKKTKMGLVFFWAKFHCLRQKNWENSRILRFLNVIKKKSYIVVKFPLKF
jgi:hypothetical protein